MRQHADHVEIQKSEGKDNDVRNSSKEFQKYRFTKLPDGYSLQNESFDNEFQKYWAQYTDEKENVLLIQQTFVEGEAPGNATSDIKPIEKVEINVFNGYYAKDNKIGTLVLTDNIYMLVIHGELSKEELIELAEGLELEKNP